MHAAVQLEQFEIDTQQEKLLFVELFTIDAKVCFIQSIFDVWRMQITNRILSFLFSWSTKY